MPFHNSSRRRKGGAIPYKRGTSRLLPKATPVPRQLGTRPDHGFSETVVHLTAEYWPYARSGGLAEAVRGIARYQARIGPNRSGPFGLLQPVADGIDNGEQMGARPLN